MMAMSSLTINSSLAANGWFELVPKSNSWGFYYCDFKLDTANVALVRTLNFDSSGGCINACLTNKSLMCTHFTYDFDAKVCYLVQAKNPDTIQFRPYYEVGHVTICGFLGQYSSKF